MTIFNNRILLVDDNESIHLDIKHILQNDDRNGRKIGINKIEDELFGSDASAKHLNRVSSIQYEISSAYQGGEALKMFRDSYEHGNPYALVIMDVRMPPGMDGIQTIKEMRNIDNLVELVICTAYSDYGWEQIVEQLGMSDKIQFLSKPFESITLKQLALSLTTKWNIAARKRQYIQLLENETEKLGKTADGLGKRADKQSETNQKSNASLLNHQSLVERLTSTVSGEGYKGMAIIALDLVGFKNINEAMSFSGGDLVLKELETKLAAFLDIGDFMGRVGADEYVVILTAADSAEAKKWVEQLESELSIPVLVDEVPLRLRVQCGVKICPAIETAVDLSLLEALSALASAKSSNKDIVYANSIDDDSKHTGTF
ncbi:MAG: diguanylate cyclase [Gammaproteobacteria bacterium]|nr:diguanylate cyclase [Gammaproteobacteria bacterium]